MTAGRVNGGAKRASVSVLAMRYVDERHRRGEIRARTARTYRDVLGLFVSTLDIVDVRQLSAEHIERFLERPQAPASRRHRFSVVRRFCGWLVLKGHLVNDPTQRIAAPKVPRSLPRGLNRAQVSRVFANCPDVRAQLIVSLMVQEGLRRQEVSGLELGDIDHDERLLLVRNGKGGHERVLPLSADTAGYLARYMGERPPGDGPALRSYSDPNKGLGPEHVGAIVRAAMTEAGLRNWGDRSGNGRPSPHALRHTCATDMLRSGAHVRDVQAALGHASLGATQRYLPWIVGDLRKAMSGRSYRDADEMQIAHLNPPSFT